MPLYLAAALAYARLASSDPNREYTLLLSAALLVDEVQDVDRSQLELSVLLAGESRNIFLVGDDDQTIDAWRLAESGGRFAVLSVVALRRWVRLGLPAQAVFLPTPRCRNVGGIIQTRPASVDVPGGP